MVALWSCLNVLPPIKLKDNTGATTKELYFIRQSVNMGRESTSFGSSLASFHIMESTMHF